MTEKETKTFKSKIRGYHEGDVGVAMSVDEVARQSEELMSGSRPDWDAIAKESRGEPQITIRGLNAGYGKMEILHGFEMAIGQAQSMCLIGPNGAGKSTVLHSIYGFTNIFSGQIILDGQDITHLSPNDKLGKAGIAYILQDNSVFPDMTVEENLLMGGFLKNNRDEARETMEGVFKKYPQIAKRRSQKARVLSGGERRLLEISRALVMNPKVLLVDEPSIGLEPKYIDMVFEILKDLHDVEKKTIIMVEQNAKKGLEFADIGYVLVSGQTAKVGPGHALLEDPDVGKLFLGG